MWGYGKIAPNEITSIIEGKDRTKAGKTLPAHGLYLVEVYYWLQTQNHKLIKYSYNKLRYIKV